MSIAPIKLSKRKALKIQAQINDKSSRKSYFAKRQAKKINNIAVSKRLMRIDKRKKNKNFNKKIFADYQMQSMREQK